MVEKSPGSTNKAQPERLASGARLLVASTGLLIALAAAPAKADPPAVDASQTFLDSITDEVRALLATAEEIVGTPCMDGIVSGAVTISIGFAVATLPPSVSAMTTGAAIGCAIRVAEDWLRAWRVHPEDERRTAEKAPTAQRPTNPFPP
jgi:hypothetical protein